MKIGRQSGAALIVCLILLSVLTLLALSTMSTAALELAMTGNDHYGRRAFEAAQAGVEQGIATLLASLPTGEMPLSGTLVTGDRFTAIVRPRGAYAPPPAYDPTFTAAHFEVESTGTSLRGTKVAIVQGLFVIQPRAGAAAEPAMPPACTRGIQIRPGICADIGTAVRTYWRTSDRSG